MVSIFTSLILYKKIQEKSIYYNLIEFWIINLLGFVPISFLLMVTAGLWINFNPQASIHEIENIDINEINVRKKGIQIESFTFHFQDNFLNDYPMARTIDIEDNKMKDYYKEYLKNIQWINSIYKNGFINIDTPENDSIISYNKL